MKELAKITPQNRIAVQKFYNTNSEKIKQQINILKTWIRKQRHFPQNQDDRFLENILLRTKFRIEETKRKLENYYTLKGHYREFFQDDYTDYIPSKLSIIIVPMPNLCPDLGRLYILKWRKLDITQNEVIKVMRSSVLNLELVLTYEYAKGEHVIMDCAGLTLEHAKILNISVAQKMFKLYEKAYSGRLLSIDVINAPNLMTILMPMMKMLLSEKFYKKVRIHASIDSLVQIYGKECLISDYGGELEDVETLHHKWDRVYREKQDFFKFCANNVADEKLRVGGVRQDGSFGVDGTFQKLNID